MKRELTHVAIGIACGLLGLALAAGCGGSVDGPGAGGARPTEPPLDGGSQPDVGPSCAMHPECAAPATCRGVIDTCNTCNCSGDEWTCTLVECFPACPATAPVTGDSCPADGQTCGDHGAACGTSCKCESGQWRCSAPPCGAAPACPDAAPEPLAACTPLASSCSYLSARGCGMVCSCPPSSDGGPPIWLCTVYDCFDGG
jgi:hypothetical protein